MDPVDAELKLIVQSDIIKPGLDFDLAMDVLANRNEIMFNSFDSRRPIRDLDYTCGFIDGHRGLAGGRQHEADFFDDFFPKVDGVIGSKIHR